MANKIFFKTTDGRYISLDSKAKPEDMEKARVTKYVKRVPKPSGKGYYYFYTKQQFDKFKQTGEVPTEKKGSVLSGIMKFFGLSDEKAAESKARAEYDKHKDSFKGVDASSFASHLNEFLSNKEKWMNKLFGEKKEKGESKPKSEEPKSEKKESQGGTGKKFNMSIMKAIAGIYGEGKKEEKKGFGPDAPESFSSDYKKFAEDVKSDIKENKDLAGYYLERLQKDIKQSGQRIKSIKKEAKGEDFTSAISKFEERIKDASILSKQIKEITGEYKTEDKKSPDNFDTMPEGEGKSFSIEGNTFYVKKNDKDKFEVRIKSKKSDVLYGTYDTLNSANYEIDRTEKSFKGEDAPVEIKEDLGRSQNGYSETAAKIKLHGLKKEQPERNWEVESFKIQEQKYPHNVVTRYKIVGKIKNSSESESETKPSAVEALKDELGKKKGDGKVDKIFNDDGEKYSALRKDAEEKFKDIKDKDEFNKKYNEFIKNNQENYLTKEEKGYKDYLEEKGISKEKHNEIKQDSRNTFSNNGVQYSIAKGVRGYNLVGGEGSGKEIKVPYGARGTIREIMMWAKDNIGMESWKLQDDNAEKSKSKYKSQSDIQKETAIQAEKERTSKLAEDEKKSGIYNADTKKLTYGSIKMDNIKDPKEKKIFEQLKTSNMINDKDVTKPLYSFSSEGQDAGVWTDSRMMILDKNVSDEIYNTNKQREFNRIKRKNPNMSDDEIIGQIIDKGTGSFPNYKQVIPREDAISKTESKLTGRYYQGEKNVPDIVEYSDGDITARFLPDYVATIKNKFPDAKMYLSGDFSPAVFKVGNEIKAVLMPIKNSKEMSTMEKALSNLREEIMLKAQTTKYIKKIPNPKGKGYIYFYTQQQVKDYNEKGTLPDQKKEGEKKPEGGKGNIEILKESIKKVASIFADALSARDAVQPTGTAVEQTGENVSAKSKEKKRLEENKKKVENKPNKPEEKPKK